MTPIRSYVIHICANYFRGKRTDNNNNNYLNHPKTPQQRVLKVIHIFN